MAVISIRMTMITSQKELDTGKHLLPLLEPRWSVRFRIGVLHIL